MPRIREHKREWIDRMIDEATARFVEVAGRSYGPCDRFLGLMARLLWEHHQLGEDEYAVAVKVVNDAAARVADHDPQYPGVAPKTPEERLEGEIRSGGFDHHLWLMSRFGPRWPLTQVSQSSPEYGRYRAQVEAVQRYESEERPSYLELYQGAMFLVYGRGASTVAIMLRYAGRGGADPDPAPPEPELGRELAGWVA